MIRDGFQRVWSNPQVVVLLLLLGAGALGIYFFGSVLAPVLAAIVMAYLLEGPVAWMEKRGASRLTAVLVVFALFVSAFAILQLALVPVLMQQLGEFLDAAPGMVRQVQDGARHLAQLYPGVLSGHELRDAITASRTELVALGQRMLSFSVMSAVQLLVNLVLIPFLVFFFLKDKAAIVRAAARLISRDGELARSVWRDVDQQIGNYLRGKLLEVLIIWAVSAITFWLMGLQMAIFLGLLVGLSVLVPYIGVAVMTIPVACVAYFQFGPGAQFAWILVAYAVIQLIDGNILSPWLLSELISLHPILVILSILVFGSLWGFWGVVFAVPLATLVRAVARAWPRGEKSEEPSEAADQAVAV